MDRARIYVKTPLGEEAVRQRTRLVQRNLRMVLLQVDGQVDVEGLIAKIGNESLVVAAVLELEQGGFIALQSTEKSRQARRQSNEPPAADDLGPPSVFEPSALKLAEQSQFSHFSTFGRVADSVAPPMPLPAAARKESASLAEEAARGAGDQVASVPDWRERLGVALAGWQPRFPWRYLFLAFAGLFLLAVWWVWPGERERHLAEQRMSQALAVPVVVADLSLEFFPRPVVVLRAVRFGELAHCAALRLPVTMNWLWAEKRAFSRVDIVDFSVAAAGLTGLAELMEKLHQQDANRALFERGVLQGATLDLGTFTLQGLSGEFMPGKQAEIFLQNEDRSLQFTLAGAGLPGQARFRIEGVAWRPEEKSPFQIQALQLEGRLSAQGAEVESFEMDMLGGRIRGDGHLGWGKEWGLQARLQAERIDWRRLLDLLALPLDAEGELAGSGRLQAKAAEGGKAWQLTAMELEVSVQKGVVRGLDLGEAARRTGRDGARGGMTRFDSLSASLRKSGEHWRLERMKLDAGLLQASGELQFSPPRQVTGNSQVLVRSSVAPIRAAVTIEGELPTLQVRNGR